MIKLGIIGAMDIEIQTLKEKIENLTVTEKTGTEYYEGTLQGLPVVLVKCGIGKVNAGMWLIKEEIPIIERLLRKLMLSLRFACKNALNPFEE